MLIVLSALNSRFDVMAVLMLRNKYSYANCSVFPSIWVYIYNFKYLLAMKQEQPRQINCLFLLESPKRFQQFWTWFCPSQKLRSEVDVAGRNRMWEPRRKESWALREASAHASYAAMGCIINGSTTPWSGRNSCRIKRNYKELFRVPSKKTGIRANNQNINFCPFPLDSVAGGESFTRPPLSRVQFCTFRCNYITGTLLWLKHVMTVGWNYETAREYGGKGL